MPAESRMGLQKCRKDASRILCFCFIVTLLQIIYLISPVRGIIKVLKMYPSLLILFLKNRQDFFFYITFPVKHHIPDKFSI